MDGLDALKVSALRAAIRLRRGSLNGQVPRPVAVPEPDGVLDPAIGDSSRSARVDQGAVSLLGCLG